MKKKIGILIIIIALVCFIVLWNNREKIIELENNIKSEIYGEPIYEDGTINNKFWGIESNGTKPIETRRGLSNAIDYASKNNIRYIKLEKGTYLVNCYSNESVVLKSNIEFDLNGSTIKQNLVNQKRYNVLSIHNVENVRVFNGKIEGDKETHKYTEENESAESVESITTNRRRTGEIPQRNTPPVAGTRRRRIENIQEQPVVQSNEPTGHFYVRTGDEKIEIAPQGESIGRIGSFAKMCMLNPLISRNHAMLIPDSRRGTVTIADENSLNGTSVDDGQGRRKLNRDESAVLHPGDRFWLADELFMIEGDK